MKECHEAANSEPARMGHVHFGGGGVLTGSTVKCDSYKLSAHSGLGIRAHKLRSPRDLTSLIMR